MNDENGFDRRDAGSTRFGWWKTVEHFCFPGSKPEAICPVPGSDPEAIRRSRALVLHDLRDHTSSYRHRPMIAVDFGDGWRYAYKAQKHRLVDSRVEFPDQPPKYNGVRGEKTDYRGELGDPPPLVELNPDTRRLGDTASDDSNAGAGWSGLDAAIALGDEIERRYAERVVQQRLHQPELRKMTLDHHGTACAYCGLDVPQIIEAAHLVADAEGGEASTENTRPMCPNHHRAFDAGLLLWDGSRFEPADDAPPVGPAPGPEQTPVVSQ